MRDWFCAAVPSSPSGRQRSFRVYWPPIATTVEFARKIDFINAAAISIPVLWSTYFFLSKQPLWYWALVRHLRNMLFWLSRGFFFAVFKSSSDKSVFGNWQRCTCDSLKRGRACNPVFLEINYLTYILFINLNSARVGLLFHYFEFICTNRINKASNLIVSAQIDRIWHAQRLSAWRTSPEPVSLTKRLSDTKFWVNNG